MTANLLATVSNWLPGDLACAIAVALAVTLAGVVYVWRAPRGKRLP
jgi:uncharacterized membrane protein YhfC